ncbi:putative cytochrome P450 [Lindgomyces ingoldianus]|uniref:Cytochrome P450 n=1 Tax=Lindgomyces ingoldianus TaxID=673940 RepID=A0ACB6RI01_9PLEO|nr:putative cytochrome P450 [Lindgomyces ingoldianus]KAF2478137.1 putative cytochrome P450 [Lindgomyces ingoldianus]
MFDTFNTSYFLYIALTFLVVSSFTNAFIKIPAPTVGYRSLFEPTFLLRYRFVTSAKSIIQEGYEKSKKSAFMVKRLDSDLLVLSNKYLDELRLLPNTKLSNVHAQVKNMLGKYTYTTFLLESDQHVRVLQNHLTPNLQTFLRRAEEELDYSFQADIPQNEDWTEVDIQRILRTMVARASLKVFVGDSACRNPTWIKLCLDFPINIFATAFVMRLFPPFLHPMISWFLPTRYWLRQNLTLAKKLVTPIIKDHQIQATSNLDDRTVKGTLLEWMIENARGQEGNPETLSARLMILSMASIHSTSSAIAAAIFDLCTHPEYIGLLRKELLDVVGDSRGFSKQDLNRLRKLDSFLRESQRFNPPILLSPQRVAVTDITLRDGLVIPKDQSIAFPSANLMTDPTLVPNPETFDAFRSYRKREQPGKSMMHMMVSTEKDHLYFGHGKQACPGRFFAANEIKIIVARLLLDFEFRLSEGKGGFRTWTVDEMCFADPRARIEMRRRM